MTRWPIVIHDIRGCWGGGAGGDAELTEGRRRIRGASGGDNLITALRAPFIFIFTPSVRPRRVTIVTRKPPNTDEEINK